MMRKLIGVASLCGVLLWGPWSSAQALQFHGRVEIEQEISDRLLLNQNFSFASYFTDMKGPTASVLLLLLGGYDTTSGLSIFENGDPNSVNMLLYDLVFNFLADDIQPSCVSSTSLTYNDTFTQALNTMCTWPAPAAKTQAAMENYWLAIMAYDAPQDEFVQWRNFFLNSSYANKPASEALSAMTFAILYNPNFLLKR